MVVQKNFSELFKFPQDVFKGQKDVHAGTPCPVLRTRAGREAGREGQRALIKDEAWVTLHTCYFILSFTTLKGRCYELCVSECDIIRNIYLVFIPGSWHRDPETLGLS